MRLYVGCVATHDNSLIRPHVIQNAVREIWFLRGQTSILQRAVFVGLTCLGLSIATAWATAILCLACFGDPANWISATPGHTALVFGLSFGLLLGWPLQIGLLRTPVMRAVCLTGQVMSIVAVDTCFWMAYSELVTPRLLLRSLLCCIFHLVAFELAFHAWMPRDRRFGGLISLYGKLSTFIASFLMFPLYLEGFWLMGSQLSLDPAIGRIWGWVTFWTVRNAVVAAPWSVLWWQPPGEPRVTD